MVHACVLFCAPLYLYSNTPSELLSDNDTLIAVEDHYTLMLNCNNDFLTGNLLDNDIIDSAIVAQIAYVVVSDTGLFSCGPNGNFVYLPEDGFTGTITVSYCLRNAYNREQHTEAKVYISVQPDSDCDNVIDAEDIDNDNDGILNIHEGSEENLDSDGDGIPDCFDIDSDNDGITDLIEWQREDSFIWPSMVDENHDGWDDAFDALYGGDYYEATDTDLDGFPDFIDDDSDNDGISDLVEATDIDNDSITDAYLLYCDKDFDGLDDAFDTINCCSYQVCSVLSNTALPDFDENNIRNWRDADNKTKPGEAEKLVTLENLFVYPNPTKNNCTVSFLQPLNSNSSHWQCHLYNQFGSLVLQFKVRHLPFELNIENLPDGVYQLQVFDKYNSSHASVIKTH